MIFFHKGCSSLRYLELPRCSTQRPDPSTNPEIHSLHFLDAAAHSKKAGKMFLFRVEKSALHNSTYVMIYRASCPSSITLNIITVISSTWCSFKVPFVKAAFVFRSQTAFFCFTSDLYFLAESSCSSFCNFCFRLNTNLEHFQSDCSLSKVRYFHYSVSVPNVHLNSLLKLSTVLEPHPFRNSWYQQRQNPYFWDFISFFGTLTSSFVAYCSVQSDHAWYICQESTAAHESCNARKISAVWRLRHVELFSLRFEIRTVLATLLNYLAPIPNI